MLIFSENEKLSQKNDPNIVAFEQMLGLNINEKFNIDIDAENAEIN